MLHCHNEIYGSCKCDCASERGLTAAAPTCEWLDLCSYGPRMPDDAVKAIQREVELE